MHLLGKMKEGLAFLPVCNQVHTVLVVLEAKGQAQPVVVEKKDKRRRKEATFYGPFYSDYKGQIGALCN